MLATQKRGLLLGRRRFAAFEKSSIVAAVSFVFVAAKIVPPCKNTDMNCYNWVAEEPERCVSDEMIAKECKRACGTCEGRPDDVDESERGGDAADASTPLVSEYDIRRLPPHLHKIAFVSGAPLLAAFSQRSDFAARRRLAIGVSGQSLFSRHVRKERTVRRECKIV